MRILGFILVVFGIFGLSYEILNKSLPRWEENVQNLIFEAKTAKLDILAWDALVKKSEKELPVFYPFNRVKNVLKEAQIAVHRWHDFSAFSRVDFSMETQTIAPESFLHIFDFLAENQKSLSRIIQNLRGIPEFLLPKEKKEWYLSELAWLEYLETQLEDAQKFKQIFDQFLKDKERILVLLQNQNEPRSTGGFAGSLILFDFSETEIKWKFLDIYALDRKIPLESQIEAPEFFHGLSKTISLRDANFWPDFRQSAQKYRYFLEESGETPPKTVIAINFNFVKEILKFTGPITLEKWNVELGEHNFDLVLQFLVESKALGRFDVKMPLQIFAKQLFSPENFSSVSGKSSWKEFDWKAFLSRKNILAHAQNVSLQKLFEKWNIDGQLRKKQDADNFLHFDFISIGANKSEKFVWTKIWHDSEIKADGTVINALKIKRKHALSSGELEDLLGTQKMLPNVKELINEELLWKLGAGESRVMLRVWVPKGAKIVSQKNYSGEIFKKDYGNEMFEVFEIPMYVLPNEALEAEIVYETKTTRGSKGWRPYFLQVSGTPGRDKTTFLETISTPKSGRFKADTQNIGRPQDLIDQDFRAIATFDVP